MMNKLLVVCIATLLAAACTKGDNVAEPSAKGVAGTELTGKLDKIAEATIAAKTTQHFAQIRMDCGAVEITAAGKNMKITKDPKFIEVCQVSPTKARAQLAISESTAANMSVHCLTVSMNIEELAKQGVETEAMNKLLDQVKTACGM